MDQYIFDGGLDNYLNILAQEEPRYKIVQNKPQKRTHTEQIERKNIARPDAERERRKQKKKEISRRHN